MKFTCSQAEKRPAADLLILPFWKKEDAVELAADQQNLVTSRLQSQLALNDFKATKGETLYFFEEELAEKRVLLLGLGEKEKVSAEILRRCYAAASKLCKKKGWQTLNALSPQISDLSLQTILVSASEGLSLPNYQFAAPKKEKEKTATFIEQVNWLSLDCSPLASLKEVTHTSQAIDLTRDLVNKNADEVTPLYLKECAEKMAKTYPAIKTQVLDKAALQEQNFGLLLAVSRGSIVDPYLIALSYQGASKSDPHVVLVGKGVTYDTGGLNLKPTGFMETMKCDMAGAAVCLGVMQAVAAAELKVNLTVVIPTTENGIDANSFKPGDVYRCYDGTTVEVTNTDAEGRLILADAIAFASKTLAPTHLIDIATLTGAIDVALGQEASGLMSTDDELAEALFCSGEETFERVWRMPLYEEYKERLKSDFADLKSWNGRAGSANVAAMFLSHFVGKGIKWAHLDIASTAYLSEAAHYWPKYATGFGVRLLVNFLKAVQKTN